jgi:hypothetical protein
MSVIGIISTKKEGGINIQYTETANLIFVPQ